MCFIQDEFFKHKEYKGELQLCIHDELLILCDSLYEDEVATLVENEMIRAGELYIKTVPVTVEVAKGKWWIH
jgi:DNA polymerase I-like protein with 3'-5' exonuclease and polymerase domains